MLILLKLAVLITGFLLAALTTAQSTMTSSLDAIRVHTLESKTDFMNCGLVTSEQVTSKLHLKVNMLSGELRIQELRDEDCRDDRGQRKQCCE